MRYSSERKEAVLKKMLPPHNRSIDELSREEGISSTILYNWHKQARAQGRWLPYAEFTPEGYSAVDKFAAVAESAALSEAQSWQSAVASVACKALGLSLRSHQRWTRDGKLWVQLDQYVPDRICMYSGRCLT